MLLKQIAFFDTRNCGIWEVEIEAVNYRVLYLKALLLSGIEGFDGMSRDSRKYRVDDSAGSKVMMWSKARSMREVVREKSTRLLMLSKSQPMSGMVRKSSTRKDVCYQLCMIFMIFKEEPESRREDRRW